MVKHFHCSQILLAAALIFSLPNPVALAETETPDSIRLYLPLVTTPMGNNRPPGVPANPSPADQATGQAVTDLALSWSGADPDGDAVTYSIYLDANPSNPTSMVSGSQAATQYVVSSLYPATTYTWKVVAKDSKGATTSSPVWHFKTGGGSGIPPTVDVKVNDGDGPVILTDQDSFNITWTSANATACTGSGAMAGQTGASGSFTDGPKADGPYTYTMTCSNGQGQAADTVTVTVVEPLPIETQTIAAGGSHTCALTQAGGVLCWGRNVQGQLGDDTWTDSNSPVGAFDLSSGVSAIAAGSDHTCALTQTGGVLCWGWNYDGQLGNGIELEFHGEDMPTPVEVIGLSSGVSAIAAGDAHTCALSQIGEVLCWGYKLWAGPPTDLAIPVGVDGLSSGVRAIAAGGDHICALTQTGGVLCFGENYSGQLGDGTFDRSYSPVGVFGLSTGVHAIAAGGDHTCALTQDGEVLCWGDNSYGQLGDNTYANRSTPVPVSGLSTGVSAVAAGGSHTCALLQDGGMQCWGQNWYGQLGNGIVLGYIPDEDDVSPIPVAVIGLSSGVNAVAAGGFHTCALTQAGAGQCWGYNDFGQLGDGTHANRSTPVDVDGLPPG